MSIQEMIEEARKLSPFERRELIKALVDILAEDTSIQPTDRRSIRDFRGAGARLYDGTDAQDHVNQLRDEWDDRI